MSKCSNKNNYEKIEDIRRLIKEGNYKKALYKVVNYVADNPNEAQAHYLYGKLLLRQNNLKSAKREFELAIGGHGIKESKSLMELATIAKIENDPEKAKEYYNRAIKLSGYKDSYAICCLAELQRLDKQYKEALETLSFISPPVTEVSIEKVKTLSQLGRFEEALGILETITEISRESMLHKGTKATEKQDYERAKLYFELAKATPDKDKTYYKALYEQLKLSLINENYEDVINYCESLESDKVLFDGEIYLLRGYAKQSLSRFEEAYEDYELAASSSANKKIIAQAYYNKGNIEFAKGDFHFAELSFKKSIANDKGKTIDIYEKLIGVLLRQKKYGEVKKYYNSLINSGYKLSGSIPITLLETIIDKSTGKKMPKRDSVAYAQRQAIEYKEKDAIEHIKQHHQSRKSIRGKFSKDVEIESLFYEYKNALTEDKVIYEEIMDIYEFDYPHVGYDLEHDLVHKVRVVVFPNTKKILTMYPGCRATVPKKSDFMNESQKVMKKSLQNKNV